MRTCYQLSVRMHTSQKIVYAQISHEDGKESQRHVDMILHGGEIRESAMSWCCIYHEGNKRPRLFRIPRPVGAPRHIGPDGADKDAVTQ